MTPNEKDYMDRYIYQVIRRPVSYTHLKQDHLSCRRVRLRR